MQTPTLIFDAAGHLTDYLTSADSWWPDVPPEACLGCSYRTFLPTVVARRFDDFMAAGQPEETFDFQTGAGRWLTAHLSRVQRGASAESVVALTLPPRADVGPVPSEAPPLRQEEYEFIFNGTQDAIFLMEKTEDGFVLRRNNRAHRQIFEPKGIVNPIGRTVQEILGEEVGNQVRAHYQACLDADQTKDFDQPIPLRDGTLSHWHTVLTPIRRHGRTYVLGASRNITALREAEAALRESEGRYRLLTESITDLVVNQGADGVCAYVSPSALSVLGYSPEALMESSYASMVHPEDLPAVLAWRDALRDPNRSQEEIQYRAQHAKGHYVWLATRAKAFYDADGQLTGWQTVSRDVTERYEFTQRLARADTGKTKLLSVISHDLRGMVHNTVGLIELIRQDLAGLSLPPTVEKMLDMLGKNSVNTKELLEKLLRWSLLQLDQLQVELQPFDLAAEIKRQVEQAQSATAQKKLRIKLDVPRQLEVHADPDQMSSVVRNLLNNAIKFTPEAGAISVEARAEAQLAVVTVTNTGQALDPAVRKAIEQGEAVASTKGTAGEKGVGLGLTICQEFVRLHGGRLRVKSKPGQPVSFTFSIPHELPVASE